MLYYVGLLGPPSPCILYLRHQCRLMVTGSIVPCSRVYLIRRALLSIPPKSLSPETLTVIIGHNIGSVGEVDKTMESLLSDPSIQNLLQKSREIVLYYNQVHKRPRQHIPQPGRCLHRKVWTACACNICDPVQTRKSAIIKGIPGPVSSFTKSRV